ncbi:MAG: hypothetical protein JNK23_00485 [Opitutaceae bacterium]|nr:hypothetical protein [Opitutaceae bacterium]
MIFSLRRPLAVLCLLLAPALASAAEEHPIIAKARKFVGEESTLDGLRTLRFVATMSVPDAADTTKKKTVKLDVVFEKPDRQLMQLGFDDRVEITGLDGFDGWHLLQDKSDPPRRRVTILPPARIRRLRAETWENLYYFRGLERAGGTVEDQGDHLVDGVLTRKIAYIHSPTIRFSRYFDPQTGRLVVTETEDGRIIREEGEMVVQGLRFPRTVETFARNAQGVVETVTLTFEKITINEPLPREYFAVPRPRAP